MNTRKIKLFNKEYDVFNESCCHNNNKRTLYIEITNKCNANCYFCSNKEMEIYEEINLTKLKDILDELIIRANIVDRISITGGEPLLCSNLKDILCLIDSYLDYGLEFYAITTNGTMLINENIQDVLESSKVKFINISRHHYNDLVNNRIMNISSKNSISSLELKEYIQNSNKQFRANVTLSNELYKYGDIDNFIKWAKDIGFKQVLFRKNYYEKNMQYTYGIYIYFQQYDIVKRSDKCKCLVMDKNGIEVEYREVDCGKEKENELSKNYIRNFVIRPNTILYGGWDSKSTIIY